MVAVLMSTRSAVGVADAAVVALGVCAGGVDRPAETLNARMVKTINTRTRCFFIL